MTCALPGYLFTGDVKHRDTSYYAALHFLLLIIYC